MAISVAGIGRQGGDDAGEPVLSEISGARVACWQESDGKGAAAGVWSWLKGATDDNGERSWQSFLSWRVKGIDRANNKNNAPFLPWQLQAWRAYIIERDWHGAQQATARPSKPNRKGVMTVGWNASPT